MTFDRLWYLLTNNGCATFSNDEAAAKEFYEVARTKMNPACIRMVRIEDEGPAFWQVEID